MAATTEIRVFHGAAPGTGALWVDGSLFHRADSSPTSIGSATPTPIPTTPGTARSWRKWFKVHVTAAPTGAISNLRWFSDAVALGTGAIMYVKKEATYVQASAADTSASMTGYVNATTLTSGSPLTVNAGTVLTATTGSGTQDYVVMQAECSETTPAGATAARTYTYRWDET